MIRLVTCSRSPLDSNESTCKQQLQELSKRLDFSWTEGRCLNLIQIWLVARQSLDDSLEFFANQIDPKIIWNSEFRWTSWSRTVFTLQSLLTDASPYRTSRESWYRTLSHLKTLQAYNVLQFMNCFETLDKDVNWEVLSSTNRQHSSTGPIPSLSNNWSPIRIKRLQISSIWLIQC